MLLLSVGATVSLTSAFPQDNPSINIDPGLKKSSHAFKVDFAFLDGIGVLSSF